MDETLLQQVNNLLEKSPLPDEDIMYWQERLPKMNDEQKLELLDLLKEKLKIITDTNDLFIKIAEDIDEEQQKEIINISKEPEILDMKIGSLEDLFRGDIIKFLKKEDDEIFGDLDEYFLQAKVMKVNLNDLQKTLLNALLENKEKLSNGFTVNNWLREYMAFSSDQVEHDLSRINFLNQNSKKLSSVENEFLLKLLKLYDFLREITFENITERQELKEEQITVAKQETPKTEIENSNLLRLQKMAENYPPGSLERLAIQEEIKKNQGG